MNIRILSKNNIEKAIMKGIKDKTAIISFSDPVYKKRIDKSYRTVDFSQTNCRVFKVAVLDVDIQYLKDYELDYSSFFPEANDFPYISFSYLFRILKLTMFILAQKLALPAEPHY